MRPSIAPTRTRSAFRNGSLPRAALAEASARLAEVHQIAERLLSNPVIEDFEVHVEDHRGDDA